MMDDIDNYDDANNNSHSGKMITRMMIIAMILITIAIVMTAVTTITIVEASDSNNEKN